MFQTTGLTGFIDIGVQSIPVTAVGIEYGPKLLNAFWTDKEKIVLINCVAYENGSRLADLPVEEISDYLERPDCFVWVALCDPSPQELDKMKEEFELHELAVEDARHGHQRPRI